jgi:hypothetical protein
MQRVSKGEMFCLSAYWAGHSFMWNSLHPIVLPAILIGFVPDAQKNTYLGLLTFAGLTIAMIVQPVAGTSATPGVLAGGAAGRSCCWELS